MSLTQKDTAVDNKPSTNEVLPRKALTFGVVGLIVLLIFLVWLGFRQQAQKNANAVELGAQSQVDRSTVSDSEFQDKIGREVKRKRDLRRMRELTPDVKKDPVQLIQEIKQRENNMKRSVEKDPYEQVITEFRVEELRRALAARNSPIMGGFGADDNSGSGTSTGRPTYDLESGTLNKTNGAEATALRKRINDLNKSSNAANNEIALAENKYTKAKSGVLDQFTASANTPSPQPQPLSPTTNGSSIEGGFGGSSSRSAIPEGYAGSNATYLIHPPFGSVTIRGGVVIPIVLQTNVSSDTPGQFIARVSRDVYDETENFIVIPAGSKVLGNAVAIETENEAVNNRMGMVVSEIRRTDGMVIDMEDHGLLDSDGLAGIKGKTNYHVLAQVLATIGYVTTVGGTAILIDDLLKADVGAEVAVAITCRPTTKITTVTDAEGNVSTVEETSEICTDNKSASGGVTVQTGDVSANATITSEFLRGMGSIGEKLFGRYIGLTPTKTLGPGDPMTLITSSDIYAAPWRSVYEDFVE